jgi:hypothetical protein
MTTHGFSLIHDQFIPELRTHAQLYRHEHTGAQLLSLVNDDENKTFGITFRTPPSDSTGVPHILEHSVLGGSRKYPVKSPFDELAKGSFKTFLNAMTFPDKTVYPVSSTNLKDFYNLVDVYLDAVLHPRIEPQTLAQEGWHYELDAPDAPLTFRGIVFNEMKGAYSSPEGAMGRWTRQALFPNHPYGNDSGGDPQRIPDLTYEQFKHFHATFYHPSNARIFFYGDDPVEERLRRVNEFLKEFDTRSIEASIPLQTRFTEPQRITRAYDASKEASKSGKRGMVTVNWLLTEPPDAQTSMTLGILAYILVGTSASPLRKALIDSGLGEDVLGGLNTSLREYAFSSGLKGIEPNDADKVEQLIIATLTTLAREKIDGTLIEAALNTLEFSLRENNTGGFPRGLALMFRVLGWWLYDRNPFDVLGFEAPLAALKARLASGERVFETLIEQYWLQNPHRLTVVLTPDPALRAREDAVEQARLAQARATMSGTELQAVIVETHALKQRQLTPDTPEALATIPHLQLSDLDKTNKLIPIQTNTTHGNQIVYHDLFTNGIVYLDVGMNLRALPQACLPYVPLFGRALLEMGTKTEDYTQLTLRIGRKTGGIGRGSLTTLVRALGSRTASDASAAWLFLRGKGTMAQTQDLLAILRDVLLTVKLDNPARFKQIVLMEKARQEAGLIPAGNAVAGSRVRAAFNESDWLDEQMSGVSYLFFLRELSEVIDKDWASVLAKLETIHRTLVTRDALLYNVTLDAANWAQFEPQLHETIAQLPTATITPQTWTRETFAAHEGLTMPSQGNYVAKGANIYAMGYSLRGSALVASAFVSRNFVRERVRVQGGAYGGACGFDRRTGVFTFTSYRDPNLLKTLENYDEAAHWLRHVDIGASELTNNIIGTMSSWDAYMLPDAKGFASLSRYLANDDDDLRQQLREEILSTTISDIRNFADALDYVRTHGRVVVLGSPQAIDAANAERGGMLSVVKVQ